MVLRQTLIALLTLAPAIALAAGPSPREVQRSITQAEIPELPDTFIRLTLDKNNRLLMNATLPKDFEPETTGWWDAYTRFKLVVRKEMKATKLPEDFKQKPHGWWDAYIRFLLTVDDEQLAVDDEYKEFALAWARAYKASQAKLPDWVTYDNWGPRASLENKKRTHAYLTKLIRDISAEHRLIELLYAVPVVNKDDYEKVLANYQSFWLKPEMTPAASLSFCPSSLITGNPNHPMHPEFVAAMEKPEFKQCFDAVRKEFSDTHETVDTNRAKTLMLREMVESCGGAEEPR